MCVPNRAWQQCYSVVPVPARWNAPVWERGRLARRCTWTGTLPALPGAKGTPTTALHPRSEQVLQCASCALHELYRFDVTLPHHVHVMHTRYGVVHPSMGFALDRVVHYLCSGSPFRRRRKGEPEARPVPAAADATRQWMPHRVRPDRGQGLPSAPPSGGRGSKDADGRSHIGITRSLEQTVFFACGRARAGREVLPLHLFLIPNLRRRPKFGIKKVFLPHCRK